MKRILAVIATGMVAVGSAAFAAEDHAKLHEHMKKMREQMAQIRAATDPREKERLVNQHLKTMEDAMSKMQGMKGCGKM